MSISEANRLIKQGAVKIDGVKITQRVIPLSLLKDGSIIQVGKRMFRKIRLV